jgi:hypothetical protein
MEGNAIEIVVQNDNNVAHNVPLIQPNQPNQPNQNPVQNLYPNPNQVLAPNMDQIKKDIIAYKIVLQIVLEILNNSMSYYVFSILYFLLALALWASYLSNLSTSASNICILALCHMLTVGMEIWTSYCIRDHTRKVNVKKYGSNVQNIRDTNLHHVDIRMRIVSYCLFAASVISYIVAIILIQMTFFERICSIVIEIMLIASVFVFLNTIFNRKDATDWKKYLETNNLF